MTAADHADTIFRVLASFPTPAMGGREQAAKALDALLAENQRLRGSFSRAIYLAGLDSPTVGEREELAAMREALAGDAE